MGLDFACDSARGSGHLLQPALNELDYLLRSRQVGQQRALAPGDGQISQDLHPLIIDLTQLPLVVGDGGLDQLQVSDAALTLGLEARHHLGRLGP